MARLQFYVEANVATQIKRKAAQSNLTVSKYLAALATRDAGTDSSWPKDYFALFGSWAGEPLVHEAQPPLEERIEFK
jgi:hypothetical protein